MTRKFIPVALALSLAAVFALAQDSKRAAKITGFVVDNMCASAHNLDVKAKQHETSCLLMDDCRKAGYAVVSKDIVYKLDARGNELVHAIIKDTKIKKGFAVYVEGTVENGTLHVDKLEEAR